jgi:hypothetical protein
MDCFLCCLSDITSTFVFHFLSPHVLPTLTHRQLQFFCFLSLFLLFLTRMPSEFTIGYALCLLGLTVANKQQMLHVNPLCSLLFSKLSASPCLAWQHLATHLAAMISCHHHCCCFQKAMLIYLMPANEIIASPLGSRRPHLPSCLPQIK